MFQFRVCALWGTPLASNRAVNGISRVAPCVTQTFGENSARSFAEEVPLMETCTVLGGLYDAGASAAVMVVAPTASMLTRVSAWPLSSVNA